MTTLTLPGITRVSPEDFFAYGLPSRRDAPFWIDQVLYDIPNTTEMAVRQAARNGAGAVTLYEPLVWATKYRCVVEACFELNLIIVTAREPDYIRSVWWQPQQRDKAHD